MLTTDSKNFQLLSCNILKYCKIFVLSVFIICFASSKSYACYCCDPTSYGDIASDSSDNIQDAHSNMFEVLRDQLISVAWWEAGVKPLAMQLTLELTSTGWARMAEIGAFIDAKIHSETMLDMQVMAARATKRHIPSVNVCKFASLNKTTAQSNYRGNFISSTLNKYSLDRTLGSGGSIGASNSIDIRSRSQEALLKHCDPGELSNTMDSVCGAAAGSNGLTSKDINYGNTLATPDTINLLLDPIMQGLADDTDTNPHNNNDTASILALKQLLYNHEVAPRMGKIAIGNNIFGHQNKYLKWRANAAKRSVAENSFDTIVGMKAAGGGAVGQSQGIQTAQATGLYQSLGLSTADINELNKLAPSYWAQMEHLTKTLYKDPSFFVNLYDNPENVTRQSASMEAISLMQMRDYYESLIRSEMALSVMLDTEVRKEIQKLNNTIQSRGN